VKLRKLEISTFKNLRNFSIDFSQNLTTVLLGRNGTGKSNLLEALIIIFRDLDLGEVTTFPYRLEYECRGRLVSIDSDPDRPKSKRDKVLISIQHLEGSIEKISYNKNFYGDSERRYLPSYVFGYYSGPSNRMEEHFDTHQNRFYQDQLKGKDEPRRPLFYARSVQSQFALLAFFMEEEQDEQEGRQSARQFLYELLGIEKLISVLFVLHEPSWSSKEGDPRFWNARGVLGQFLAHLYEIALAPMRRKRRITPEFASSTNLEHLYFYLRNEEDLKKLFAYYGDEQEFFKALESTYISKILSEVRIRLKRRDTEDTLTFRDLSEGEQQLLMVLGLLRFTKADEALFLLDEPDTHLNPTWSVQYLEFMRWVVGDQPTSQVVMTTHNPLVISSLERQDVRIMQRNNTYGSISAFIPEDNPQGMGVAAILTSDLFGLRSTLDIPTQDRLDRRRELAFRDDEDLTQEDERELSRLNNILSHLDFSITARDPLYQDFASEYREFVKRFTLEAEADLKQGIVFTTEQRQRQRELARQILHKIKEQQL
jgi:predicted ATPase